MKILKFALLAATLLNLLLSCRYSRANYYCYDIDAQTTDTILGARWLYRNSLISYGQYLFEFKTKTHLGRLVNGSSENFDSIKFDTLGIYLLVKDTNRFYEFDTFSLQAKLVHEGAFEEKNYGMSIPTSKTKKVTDVHYGTLKPISIKNIDCFYADVLSNDINQIDTVQTQVLLIKQPGLKSPFNLANAEFPDKAYCIVGFRMNHLRLHQSATQSVTSFRKLTEREAKICEYLVRKANKFNVEQH